MQRKSTQSGHKPNAPPSSYDRAYEKLVNLKNLETLRPFCVTVCVSECVSVVFEQLA
jgi:hypothetical protein